MTWQLITNFDLPACQEARSKEENYIRFYKVHISHMIQNANTLNSQQSEKPSSDKIPIINHEVIILCLILSNSLIFMVATFNQYQLNEK